MAAAVFACTGAGVAGAVTLTGLGTAPSTGPTTARPAAARPAAARPAAARPAAAPRFPLVVRNSFARVSHGQLQVDATVVNAGTAGVGATQGSVAWRASARQGLVSVTTFRLSALAKGASRQLNVAAQPPVGTRSGRYAVFVCLDLGSVIRKFSVSTNCANVETVSIEGGSGKSGPAPKTTITRGPSGWSSSRTARFAFKSSIAKSSFQCAFDGGVWLPCKTGVGYAGLAQGQHQFQVRAVTPSGAIDASPARASWTVDTVAPNVSITSPGPGATLLNDVATFSGRAGTASGDLATITVRLYPGSSTSGTPLATFNPKASSGSWSVQTSALADGQYTIRASQTDRAGNTRTTDPTTFSIAPPAPVTTTTSTTTPPTPVAPTVTLTGPSGGAYSNDTTPTFAGQAGTDSGDSGVTLNIYQGTTASGTPEQDIPAGVGSDGSWSAQAAALADGTYTAQAVQTNGSLVGDSTAVTFTVDTVAPTPTIIFPSQGTITNETTPTITGDAGTAPGDLPGITVEIYAGDSATGTPQLLTTSASAGTWSVTPTIPLTDGDYTIVVIQSDQAGNTSAPVTVTFTVDTTAPTVTITSPTANEQTNDTTPTISGTAGDAAGDDSAITVNIYSGSSPTGTPVETLAATESGGNWSVPVSPALSSGSNGDTYTVQAQQSNEIGSIGRSSAVTFTVDTTAPAVTISSPTAGQRTNNTTPTITGTAGSAATDHTTVTVKIYEGDGTGGTLVDTLDPTVTGGTWSTTSGTLTAQGDYTIVATQSDQAGNTSTPATVTFAFDTTPPDVTITSPTAAEQVDTATPTITGDSGTAAGDLQAITVDLYAGTTPTGSPTVLTPTASAGTWSVQTGTLANGEYTVEASQSDQAGNTKTTDPVTFTVDTTPTVTLTSPANNSDSNQTEPTFAGQAGTDTGDSGVTLTIYGAGDAVVDTLPATVQLDGSWSVQETNALSDGTYTAQATQTNDGATGTSNTITFTVDTTAPDVTITSPTAAEQVDTATPTITGDAGTAAGDLQAITVDLYAGTTPTGSPTVLTPTASAGTWSVQTGTLANGEYTVEASQSDQAGNTKTTDPVTFTVDTTPTVTLDSPGDGTTSSETEPTFAGNAGTDTGDSGVTLTIYAGSDTSGSVVDTLSATVQLDGSWSVQETSALGFGTYTAQATQTNDGATGDSNTVTFDVAPDVTIDPVAPEQPDGTVTITFSSTDASATFLCNFNNTGYSPCTSPYTTDDLTDGSYTFSVEAVDPADNPGVPQTVEWTSSGS